MSSAGQSKPSPTKWPVATTSSGGSFLGRDEPFVGCCALLRAHAAFEDDWFEPSLGERGGEVVDVARSLGEDKAVPTATDGIDHVVEDLLVARFVLGESAVDACDGTRDRQIGWVFQPERCGVDDEHGARPVSTGAFEGVGVGVGEGVAYWAELEADQIIEAVAPVRGGGQPDPVAGGDRTDRGLERGCRDVMALVDDDLTVHAQLVGEVGPAGESLQGGDVDDAGEFGAATAELPWFDTEQVVIWRRHWSASVLRSTSTSVGIARWAMTAQAITVLPEPGGATRSPSSCGITDSTASCCCGLRSKVGERSKGSPMTR